MLLSLSAMLDKAQSTQRLETLVVGLLPGFLSINCSVSPREPGSWIRLIYRQSPHTQGL